MKYKFALLLISAVILLTACSGKREGLELADASTAANNAKTELAELKSENPYKDKNIDFSGAIDFLPENVGDMYVLRKSKDGKEFSQAEMYDMFIESVNREFPNSEHAKDNNNYIFSSEKCDSPHWDENKELKYLCLYESDYLQRIKDEAIDDVGFFAYTTYETNRSHDSKQEFLLMSDDCYMVQLRHSDTWQKVEFDMSFESWVPLWTLNIKAYATPDDEKEYKLSGGERVTVKDAVKMCEDYFTNSYFNINKAMHFKVVCVYILEVDENTESFYYYLTPEYNGIPMDYVLTNGSFSEYSDGNHYDSEYNSAFMSRAGEIERFDCVFNRVITPIGG